MALEIKKKEKESSQNLVRRFTKSIKGSGILIRTRKAAFRERKKSKEMKKKAALRREEIKREIVRLKKLGK